jgi:hypothetical protein
MADSNIPAGTTLTVSGLSANSTDTIEGNSTAAYGVGGGTLNSTGPLAGHCNVTVTGGVFDVDGVANSDTITLNNATLDITGGEWNSSTVVNFGTGSSGVIVPPADATSPNLGGVQFNGGGSAFCRICPSPGRRQRNGRPGRRTPDVGVVAADSSRANM